MLDLINLVCLMALYKLQLLYMVPEDVKFDQNTLHTVFDLISFLCLSAMYKLLLLYAVLTK